MYEDIIFETTLKQSLMVTVFFLKFLTSTKKFLDIVIIKAKYITGREGGTLQ